MADNVTAKDATAATITLATDNIAGVNYPRIKVGFGDDGSYADASSGNPLPIQMMNAIPAGTNGIGTVSITASVLPTGAATSVKQPALGTAGTASSDVLSMQGIAGGIAVAISAASLPIPAGAATAAKQPTLGTAGTASTDVLSMQGVAGGVAIPVSAVSLPLPAGAATVAKQPALGTAGTASSDVLSMQGIAGGVAIAISAAVLPLPTGAAIAAKQPALGVAGTASSDVLTIQGAPSMVAVKVDGSAVVQPVSGTLTVNVGTAGTLALDATLTGGTQKTKIIDSGGSNVLSVDAGGGLAIQGNGASGSAVVTKTIQIGGSDGTNLRTLATDINGLAKVHSYIQTDAMFNAAVSTVPLKTFANIAQSLPDQSLVTLTSGKIIRVLSVVMVAGATPTNITFNSKGSGAGTPISPLFANGANGGAVLPFDPFGHFDTNVGEALTVTTGAGSTTGILIKYILI